MLETICDKYSKNLEIERIDKKGQDYHIRIGPMIV